LQRLWAAFESKPALAGAFGLATCAMLITGVIYSDRTDVQPMAFIPGQESSASSPQEIANTMAANHPLLAKPAEIGASGTSLIAAPPSEGPLWGNLHAQPAALTFPGGN
jgi:hypothetical protein